MKKFFSVFVVFVVLFVICIGFTSCEESGGPSSPIVGIWEYVDDSEHVMVFGNMGDYVDVIRQQPGEKYANILNSGVYFYNGIHIDFVDPASKDTHMYYIELKNGRLVLTSSITGEIIELQRGTNRGLIWSI